MVIPHPSMGRHSYVIIIFGQIFGSHYMESEEPKKVELTKQCASQNRIK